ncbi:MAG: DUF5132 domain-containing protein [Nitrospirae bacterium]|nr:DUF5132 domain-containing protein [Nitrospirota bacterium]MBF0521414.1 DUF5132 domain-containing protein [Nitrospirota bacterium]MBF0535969.1 DUF5132 domain-containing protein [Nitrospirota bacterium]MBF0618055.1 DUF5132 domain-containing protein [Nitrospirota bacterium]
MGFFEDAFKGDTMKSFAIGLGAVVIGPALIGALASVVKPLTKAAIKGALVLTAKAKVAMAEFGEVTEDIVAEAKAELEESQGDMEV